MEEPEVEDRTQQRLVHAAGLSKLHSSWGWLGKIAQGQGSPRPSMKSEEAHDAPSLAGQLLAVDDF